MSIIRLRDAVVKPEPDDRYMTRADICRYLHIGERTLDRLISSGRFPKADLTMGRLQRWRASTVIGWSGWESGR